MHMLGVCRRRLLVWRLYESGRNGLEMALVRPDAGEQLIVIDWCDGAFISFRNFLKSVYQFIMAASQVSNFLGTEYFLCHPDGGRARAG